MPAHRSPVRRRRSTRHEDYSNYPLANAYKYCDRGSALACQQAQRLNAEDNAPSAFGSAVYPALPAPTHYSGHHVRQIMASPVLAGSEMTRAQSAKRSQPS